VLIEHCAFNTDDDCIAIKAGRDADGRRVNIPCRNILIRDCQFQAGHGGVTAGSETAAGIRNVFIEQCRFDSPNLRMAIRVKTNPRRGGFIERFYVRHCTVKTAEVGIHMTMRYDRVTEGGAIPRVGQIAISDVVFEQLKQAIFLEGLNEDARIAEVAIVNCTFRNTRQKSALVHTRDVHLVNTTGTGLE
jgi:polygalacturonase